MPTAMVSRRACLLGLFSIPVSAWAGPANSSSSQGRVLYLGSSPDEELIIDMGEGRGGSSKGMENAFDLPRPRDVRINPAIQPDQILVDQDRFAIRHVFAPGWAREYPVGLGRDGLEFSGSAIIKRKAKWPSWTPTPAMIERNPEQYAQYADGVPGGPENPLGARALYLYRNGKDTYYRIHGTDAPSTIGTSVSNGCIRMLNAHVKDLYDRVKIGTIVRTI